MQCCSWKELRKNILISEILGYPLIFSHPANMMPEKCGPFRAIRAFLSQARPVLAIDPKLLFSGELHD